MTLRAVHSWVRKDDDGTMTDVLTGDLTGALTSDRHANGASAAVLLARTILYSSRHSLLATPLSHMWSPFSTGL